MSLVTVEEIIPLIAPGIDDEALQGVINREESWLAKKIGPLTGERIQKLWVPRRWDGPLLLQRPTDSVEITDGTVDLTADSDYVVLPAGRLERLGMRWYGPSVTVTYTPNDELDVKRVVIELVRIALSASPYSQESSDNHQYSRTRGSEAQREALASSLRPKRGPTSVGIPHSSATDRVTRL